MVVGLQLGALMLLAHGQFDAKALLLLPVLIIWYSILLTCLVCTANRNARGSKQNFAQSAVFSEFFSRQNRIAPQIRAYFAPIIRGRKPRLTIAARTTEPIFIHIYYL
jgi:hypothetical protein